MSERRKLHHRSASVNALVDRKSSNDRRIQENKRNEEEKPYEYQVEHHRSRRHAPETQDPDAQHRRHRHHHSSRENNNPKYASQRPTPISTSSHHRSHSSSSRAKEHSSRKSSGNNEFNSPFTPVSPAESIKSAHQRPPPLPLDTIEQLKYSSSSRHRSKSARSVGQKHATPELDKFEIKNVVLSPKEEPKQIENPQPQRTRTRKRVSAAKQPEQKVEQLQPQQSNHSPHYKSFREILAEKPKFASQAQPKPLIGTEYDQQFKPMVVKPLAPTSQLEERNKFERDNIPDDYRGRRLGQSPLEGQALTYANDKNIQKPGDDNKTEKDKKERHVKLDSSARHRSASAPKKMRSSNQNLWLPPSMEKFNNISIDGEIIIPQKAALEQSDSSSMLTPITGSNNSEEPIKMTDETEFEPELRREDINKKKYRPPKLKAFDGAPISRIAPPLSATVADPAKTLKRFENPTPAQIDIPQEDQIPKQKRTRRRKPAE